MTPPFAATATATLGWMAPLDLPDELPRIVEPAPHADDALEGLTPDVLELLDVAREAIAAVLGGAR